MLINVMTLAFISIFSLLTLIKQRTPTGRASFLVFFVGFALLALDFATRAKSMPFLNGFSLLFVGFAWICADAYGCLEWSKRRRG